MSVVHVLEPAVRDYAWGSRHVLADLQGRPSPTPAPEAEAWFGAHPTAPALALRPDGATPLDELVAADPAGLLGDEVVARFGPQLPFLVKILAAEAPLSLQAHPSAAQARAGFAAEEERAIARDAPHRSFPDAWPKPELLVALTPFTALCGFREPGATARFLSALEVPALSPLADRLARDGEDALAPAIAWALRDGRDAATAVLRDLHLAAARVGDRARRGTGPAEPWWPAAADLVAELVDRYPGDPGTVVALLLEQLELAPGDAIHLPAGNLHAYLRGAGIEVMASSDNVLRGGLTPKHVDVPALLEAVDARVLPPPFVAGTDTGTETVFTTPTAHFRASRLRLGPPVTLDRRGPQILVVVDGAATVTADGHTVAVPGGHGAFVAASAGEVTVAGDGQLFRTTVGEPA